MLSYSQFSYQWKIPLAETDFPQRLCICVQQTCHASKYFPILYLPVCCCEGETQHCDFTFEANKGSDREEKQTDDHLLPISAGTHLKCKWVTFKCISWKRQTDETWEPEQILNPKWWHLSSGDVLGMIARQRLACTDGSSRNPQRSVWTSETHGIAGRTEKWLSCLIQDFDPCSLVVVWCVCVCAEFRPSCLHREVHAGTM